MRIELDIPDNKAASLLEVLKSISFIKINTISTEKAILIEEMKEAIAELNLVKAGKKKARNARELLNEL